MWSTGAHMTYLCRHNMQLRTVLLSVLQCCTIMRFEVPGSIFPARHRTDGYILISRFTNTIMSNADRCNEMAVEKVKDCGSRVARAARLARRHPTGASAWLWQRCLALARGSPGKARVRSFPSVFRLHSLYCRFHVSSQPLHTKRTA